MNSTTIRALQAVRQIRVAWRLAIAGQLTLNGERVWPDLFGAGDGPVMPNTWRGPIATAVGCLLIYTGRTLRTWENLEPEAKFLHCLSEGSWALDHHDFTAEEDVRALVESIRPFVGGVPKFVFDQTGEAEIETVSTIFDAVLEAARLRSMLVMMSNHTSFDLGRKSVLYPGALGHLYSPDGFRPPPASLPYAFDNGAWGCHVRNRPFDERAFLGMLDRAKAMHLQPLWVVVPDAVGDRRRTLDMWRDWEAVIEQYGYRKAFAAQDGMIPDDVPPGADVVFLGGSIEFKQRAMRPWCKRFNWVHLGRVGGLLGKTGLLSAHAAGITSCDSTRFVRGDQRYQVGLETYLAWTKGDIQVPRMPVISSRTRPRANTGSGGTTSVGQLSLF